MSLEFSRRSFMKLTALTAVAVAGSSLLSGCDSSSTLYPSGAFGKELTLMGKFTVSNPKYDADAKTLTCAFKGTCTSDTPLAIRSKFFQVEVLRDKKKTIYSSCKPWSGYMAEMQRRFTKDLGVPCAGFDGDQADPRNFNEAQYATRVQGLVEAMEANKKD